MSCNPETPAVTLAKDFALDSSSPANYYVINYTTTTKDSSGNLNTSCLPTAGTPPVSSFSRTEMPGGVILAAKLSEQINKLTKDTGRAPNVLTPSDNDPIAKFAREASKLRSEIRNEYCYYYNRYAFILNACLVNLSSTDTAISDIGKKQRQCVNDLNSVLNQILQVYQALINSRNATLQKYYTDSGMNLNSLNEEVDRTRDALQKQSSILENTNLAADVQSAMIEYSLEKNQSSRNLLVIYGFMNLVAAGLIVYLYRSTRA